MTAGFRIGCGPSSSERAGKAWVEVNEVCNKGYCSGLQGLKGLSSRALELRSLEMYVNVETDREIDRQINASSQANR